jgi:NADPH:quinone reductase
VRALIHETFGDPGDVLTMHDVPMPQPQPGEVRVRMLLSPVHRHDTSAVDGTYDTGGGLPSGAGTEAVGVVDAVGDGVTVFSPGERVATVGSAAVWAEYFVAPEAALVAVDDSFTDEVAAQMSAMPLSALMLLDHLRLEPGQWFVQNAANGTVGRVLAQLAAARGVHVLGLVRRHAGIAELERAGIKNVVSTENADWAADARDITGGAALRFGIDSVGGPASSMLASLVADDGVVYSFGSLDSSTLEVGHADVLFRGVEVKGFWAGRLLAAMPPERRAALAADIAAHVASGSLSLSVHSVHSLDDVQAAMKEAFTPGRVGKVLLRP